VLGHRIKIEFLLLTVLLVGSLALRFINLGYSDYIGDERKALLIPHKDQSVQEFLLSQRKGPMQFFVSYIPYLITGDYYNELATRLPFAALSVVSLFVFFLIVKKVSGDSHTAFLAAFLLSVNGFIVGFGRIAQYQNLNMFFSFLAVYLYLNLLSDSRYKYLSSIVGTVCWVLSVLSHWDGAFILPPVVLIFTKFLLQKATSVWHKITIITVNFVVGTVLFGLFFVPYVNNSLQNNLGYLNKRIGLPGTAEVPVIYHIKPLIDLYNPFLTFWFYVALLVVGLVLWLRKKEWSLGFFVAWFIPVFSYFILFFKLPNTHIYNFLIPVTAIIGITLRRLYVDYIVGTKFRKAYVYISVALLLFFFYQSFVIFVDHSKEYPWEQKRILIFKTPAHDKYLVGKILLAPFGFPHERYWKEISMWINEQNTTRGENFCYETNEDKTVSETYMKPEVCGSYTYGAYLIGIKKPMNFVNDSCFLQIGKKKVVKSFRNDSSEVVKIYRVDPLINR